MKIARQSRRVGTIAILFLLLSPCSSCSLNPSTNVANTPSHSPETTPGIQSKGPEVKNLLPAPTGFVNDYAHVFDSDNKARLESALVELKDKSDIEFALVTVETTGGEPIFDYSLRLAKEWGVGPKDNSKGGGLLLMLATQDREWRIQVSRSLEKDLPDEVVKMLGDRSRILYREGKYAEGLIKYVKAIIETLEKTRGFKLQNLDL